MSLPRYPGATPGSPEAAENARLHQEYVKREQEQAAKNRAMVSGRGALPPGVQDNSPDPQTAIDRKYVNPVRPQVSPQQNPRMEAVRQKLADAQRRSNEITARLQQQRAELEARQAAMRASNNSPRPQPLPQRPMPEPPRPPVQNVSPGRPVLPPRPGGTFQADLGRPDMPVLRGNDGNGNPMGVAANRPMVDSQGRPPPQTVTQVTPIKVPANVTNTYTPKFKKGGKVAAKAPVKKAMGGKVAAKAPVKKAMGGPIKAKTAAKPAAKMAKPMPAMKRGGKAMYAKGGMAKGCK